MATKQECIEGLTKLGVEFDPEVHVSTLNKLLKEQKVIPQPQEEEVSEVDPDLQEGGETCGSYAWKTIGEKPVKIGGKCNCKFYEEKLDKFLKLGGQPKGENDFIDEAFNECERAFIELSDIRGVDSCDNYEIKAKDVLKIGVTGDLNATIEGILPCGSDRNHPYTRYKLNIDGDRHLMSERLVRKLFIKEI